MQQKCQFCNKLILIKNPDPSRGSMHNHKVRCKAYHTHIDKILPKEFLIREYIELSKSAHEISKEMNIGVSPIIRKLREYNIETRNISQAKTQLRCQEKAAKTNMDRYGAPHNFSKNHPSRILWQKRLLDTEGITTVFQRQEVIDKIAEKISNTANYNKSKIGSRISKPHRKVYRYLQQLEITNIVIEYGISVQNKKKFFDIYLPDYNLIIEVNGDLFHANPIKFKCNDIVYLPWSSEYIRADLIWKRDKEKLEIALHSDHRVLVIWEHDICSKWETVKAQLLNLINGENNEKSKDQICQESIKYLQEI